MVSVTVPLDDGSTGTVIAFCFGESIATEFAKDGELGALAPRSIGSSGNGLFEAPAAAAAPHDVGEPVLE
jgi:hypothetical protein